MKKNKILTISISLIVLIILILWGVQVYKINKKYPNPPIESGKLNIPFTYMGRDFTVKGYEIKDLDSYLKKFNLTRDDVSLNGNDEIKLMLVEVNIKELKNFKDYKNFELVGCVVESTSWFNGIDREIFSEINSDKIDLITNDKADNYTLTIPFTMYKVRFSNKTWENIDNIDYQFVFDWYPIKHQIPM